MAEPIGSIRTENNVKLYFIFLDEASPLVKISTWQDSVITRKLVTNHISVIAERDRFLDILGSD